MYKPAMLSGALLGAISVILGAFAAHGLAKYLPADKIEVFQKGVTYQFYHAFALLIVGLAYAYSPVKQLQWCVPLFLAGVVCFSGSLYVYPLLEVRNVAIPVGARLVTPLGGLLFIAGWATFALGLFKK
ncbi:MAG: DUF423 domain-containing protein [Chitinophagia bacterium]|nr:DUF423 domain-containing protein [Chitinophagia bacterium]